MRASYLPRDQAAAPFALCNGHDEATDRIVARRARNRRHFFITLGVVGGLVIARLVLRFFFGVQ